MRVQRSIIAGLTLGLAAGIFTSPVLALECSGDDPSWTLEKDGVTARYTYRGQTKDFDIPHFTTSEGRDTPIAYTLVSDFDSAIFLVDAPNGVNMLPISALLMTQDRSQPIMLAGSCKAIRK